MWGNVAIGLVIWLVLDAIAVWIWWWIKRPARAHRLRYPEDES